MYVLGSVQYNTASTSAFVHNFPEQHKSWSDTVVKWLITVMYTSGGSFYFLAGGMYVLSDTGLHWWRGTVYNVYRITERSHFMLSPFNASLLKEPGSSLILCI